MKLSNHRNWKRSLTTLSCMLLGASMLTIVSGHPDQPHRTPRHGGHGHKPPDPTPFRPPALSRGYFTTQDLTPNRPDTATGLYSGGVPYDWTMGTAANYSVTYEGIVGDRSWEDRSLTEPHHGRVRSSSWLAIDLLVPAEVTVSIESNGAVADYLSLLPGDAAGAELEPAFTLYRGWQSDGNEGDTYHNQGAIEWAGDLAYIDRVANDAGAPSVEQTFTLQRGRYTLVIGGASDSSLVAGRQGFTASIDVKSLARPAAIGKAKKRYVSKKPKARLRGLFINPESAALLAVQQRKKTRTYATRGAGWSATTKRLKRGANYVFVAAISHDGTVSRWKRLTIIRK